MYSIKYVFILSDHTIEWMLYVFQYEYDLDQAYIMCFVSHHNYLGQISETTK